MAFLSCHSWGCSALASASKFANAASFEDLNHQQFRNKLPVIDRNKIYSRPRSKLLVETMDRED